MERCRLFLAEKNPQVVRRAAQAIQRQLLMLETMPEMGRPAFDSPTLRELLVDFGDSGYVALYRYDTAADVIHILAFRRQREAGY